VSVEPETAAAAGRSSTESGRYEDFAKLRDGHLKLRESFYETLRVSGAAQTASQLREFLTKVQNTGTVLADPRVRKAAQGVLSYWGAELACLPNANKEDSLPIVLAAADTSALAAAGPAAPEDDPAIDQDHKADQRAIYEDKADQRALIRLSATARQWRDSDKEPGYLLDGNTIKEAARFADQDPNLAEFVTASEQGRKKRRGRIIRAALLLFALSFGGAFALQIHLLPKTSKSWIRQIAETTSSETQTNNLVWLATFQPLMPPYDLSGIARLANVRIPGLRLYAPNFASVQLSRVLFENAQLPSASFHQSLFQVRADTESSEDRGFRWYDVTSRFLRWIRGTPPDWTRVKWNEFSGAELRLSQFTEAEITSTSFAGAHLYRATFDRALLCDVNFSNADLSNASFRNATIDDRTYGWLGKTVWWVAAGWNSNDLKKLLRPQIENQPDPQRPPPYPPANAADAKALRQAFRTSERFHTDMEIPVAEVRPGTFSRAVALNDMAWMLAVWGIEAEELTSHPGPCDSASLPKDALDAASRAVCILGDLKTRGVQNLDYDTWFSSFRDTQAYVLMQANRMPEARALYEKDLQRTEADGGMLFRYAATLYATGDTNAAQTRFENAIGEKEYLPSSELQHLKQYIPIKVLGMAYDLIDKRYPAQKLNLSCPETKSN
jgi:uncharacterized protein YjbI with pentapeptide repeats